MKTKMKTHSPLLVALATLTIAACGNYSKNPVPDIDTFRENGKAHVDDPYKAPDKETVVVTQTKDGTVDKQYITPVSKNFIQIYRDDKGEVNSFNFPVGQKVSYLIRVDVRDASIPVNDVKIDLSGSLPDGVQFNQPDKAKLLFELGGVAAPGPASSTGPLIAKITIKASVPSRTVKDPKDDKKTLPLENTMHALVYVYSDKAASSTAAPKADSTTKKTSDTTSSDKGTGT